MQVVCICVTHLPDHSVQVERGGGHLAQQPEGAGVHVHPRGRQLAGVLLQGGDGLVAELLVLEVAGKAAPTPTPLADSPVSSHETKACSAGGASATGSLSTHDPVSKKMVYGYVKTSGQTASSTGKVNVR